MNKILSEVTHSFALAGLLLSACSLSAQEIVPTPAAPRLLCVSRPGERQHCSADTSGGVAIAESRGEVACLLGKTWGYDDTGVWVADGCGGEFQLGVVLPVGAATPAPTPPGLAPTSAAPQGAKAPQVPVETWGVFDPGKGFLVGRGSAGELSISAYALVRYVNQMPGEQTFIDHLGNERSVDGRNDIWPHRVMAFFRGWLGTPKLVYTITFWTVLDRTRTPSSGTSATSSVGSSASTPASTGTRDRARSRGRTPTGSATIA